MSKNVYMYVKLCDLLAIHQLDNIFLVLVLTHLEVKNNHKRTGDFCFCWIASKLGRIYNTVDMLSCLFKLFVGYPSFPSEPGLIAYFKMMFANILLHSQQLLHSFMFLLLFVYYSWTSGLLRFCTSVWRTAVSYINTCRAIVKR